MYCTHCSREYFCTVLYGLSSGEHRSAVLQRIKNPSDSIYSRSGCVRFVKKFMLGSDYYSTFSLLWSITLSLPSIPGAPQHILNQLISLDIVIQISVAHTYV
jgi:hypothetical protein